MLYSDWLEGVDRVSRFYSCMHLTVNVIVSIVTAGNMADGSQKPVCVADAMATFSARRYSFMIYRRSLLFQ